MNDNVRSLDDERVRRVTPDQWETLAYLTNRGSVAIGVDEQHPSTVLRTLLGSCHAARMCRADPFRRVVTLTEIGRQALASKLATFTIDADGSDRLKEFLGCVASRRRDAEDVPLASQGLVFLHGAEWTWHTELGRLVAKLMEIRP